MNWHFCLKFVYSVISVVSVLKITVTPQCSTLEPECKINVTTGNNVVVIKLLHWYFYFKNDDLISKK